MAPKEGIFLGFFSFFLKFLKFSETLDMSSKQMGEMYEGDSADTRAGKFPLMSNKYKGQVPD